MNRLSFAMSIPMILFISEINSGVSTAVTLSGVRITLSLSLQYRHRHLHAESERER